MKRITTFLFLAVFISACGLLENKEQKAIEICKQSKVQFNTDNPFASLFLGAQGLNTDATWQDYANMIAQEQPNKKHDWTASSSDEEGIFIVAFADERGWGHRWEVALEEQVVKHINSNEYLCRKYGLSRLSGSEEFKITSTELDTLRFYKKYRSSDPTIIYEFKGSVLNNTDKVIIDADIKGELKLIFEEKTIEEESGYSDGFTQKISKSSPWKPGEVRKFKLKTDGIEALYAEYEPPYVFFEIQLNAEDPVGYSFDENIEEIELVEKWKKLKK